METIKSKLATPAPTFKGRINGRCYEVKEDGSIAIDPGPVLDETTKDSLRNAARGFYQARRRYPQLAMVEVERRRRTVPAPVVAAAAPVERETQPAGVVQRGAERPPAMSEKWIGVKQLQTMGQMRAQLRTNYDCWVAQGNAHGAVMETMRKRLNPLLSGFYWRNVEARVRLKAAWAQVQKEIADAAS
jgi:hypothetical protein